MKAGPGAVVCCFPFSSERDLRFSTHEYSAYKYGGNAEAFRIATTLSDRLADHLRDGGLWPNEICISGAPYNEAPTASTHLASDVAFLLNELRCEEGRPAVRTFRITKRNVHTADYGLLSSEERTAAVGESPFSCDPSFLRSRHVVVLDDLRVTGANELRLRNMFAGHELPAPTFVYYGMLDPADGAPPSIEHRLNQALVRADGSNLIEYLTSRQGPCSLAIRLNVRLIKALLSLDSATFARGLTAVRDQPFLSSLYRYALAESYYARRELRDNVELLRRHLSGVAGTTLQP